MGISDDEIMKLLWAGLFAIMGVAAFTLWRMSSPPPEVCKELRRVLTDAEFEQRLFEIAYGQNRRHWDSIEDFRQFGVTIEDIDPNSGYRIPGRLKDGSYVARVIFPAFRHSPAHVKILHLTLDSCGDVKERVSESSTRPGMFSNPEVMSRIPTASEDTSLPD